MNIKDFVLALEKLAPVHYAMPGDRIGLQIGDLDQKIAKVGLCLDITPEVIQKAIKANVNLLFAHHPLLHLPVSAIYTNSPLGQSIAQLLRHNIAVYVAHTNLDAAPEGINYVLARQEGLEPEKCEVIEPTYQEKLYKFVVFVPEIAVEKTHQAIAVAGGGHIGNYSDCTYRISGEGTFRPLAGTKPFIGTKDKLEKVKEVRIETIIPESKLPDLINQVKSVHPYEEVAYDVYPLQNPGRTIGLGLIGDLAKPVSINGRKIKRLAICSGSGGKLIHRAWQLGAEAYILGEAGYHDQLYAQSLGMEMVLKGHYETEVIILPVVKQYLAKVQPKLETVILDKR